MKNNIMKLVHTSLHQVCIGFVVFSGLGFFGCIRDFNNPIDPTEEYPIPPKPATLSAKPLPEENSVFLQFDYDYAYATGIVIERSIHPDSMFTVVDTLRPPVTTYKDTSGLKDTTQYIYRIYAINSKGVSKPTTVVQVITNVYIEKDNKGPEIFAFIQGQGLGKMSITHEADVVLKGRVNDASGVDTFWINHTPVKFDTLTGEWEYTIAINRFRTPLIFEAVDKSPFKWMSTDTTQLLYDYPNPFPIINMDTVGGLLKMSWAKNSDLDFVHFKLWLSTNTLLDTSKQSGLIPIETKDTSYTVSSYHAANAYQFLITVVDSLGNIIANGNSSGAIHDGRIYRNRMMLVPAGSFVDGEGKTAYISKDYWMDTTEVTQGMYQNVISFNPSNYLGTKKPVEGVSWYDAIKYCNALSHMEGLDSVYIYDGFSSNGFVNLNPRWDRNGYRLPTTDEWEMAARAGTDSAFYWGEDTAQSVIKNYAWYRYNALKTLDQFNPNAEIIWTDPHANEEGPQPVATKQPNAFGLYDMSGNVEEWVWDSWLIDSNSTRTDFRGGPNNNQRVWRGGSYTSNYTALKIGLKGSPVSTNPAGLRQRQVGFRVVAHRMLN